MVIRQKEMYHKLKCIKIYLTSAALAYQNCISINQRIILTIK
jgi:hypothetical protein